MIDFTRDIPNTPKRKTEEFKVLEVPAMKPVKKTLPDGSKIYKGTVTTVEQLIKDGFKGAIAVQAIPPKGVQHWGYHPLPTDVVITKAEVTTWGGHTIHYYDPKTGTRTYRNVNKDNEFNVLSGTHGQDLLAKWNEARATRLGQIGRRLVATLGTDPEIFAVDPHGEVVPAWMYLPDKKTPKQHRTHGWTGAAYWDGFQAEFTTQGTQTCLLQVSDNIQGGLQLVHNAAQAIGAKLTIENVLPVNPDYLQTESQEHVQFGCAPSWNAYGLKGNIEDGRNVPFRFAGGHLHFGISNLTKEPEKRQAIIENYVKDLDKILAVGVVSLLGELDNPIRRQFYGLPGEYRMPAHGFEYRTLSNAWLCHPLAMNMVFDLARSICGLSEEGMLDTWQGTTEEMMEIVINNDIGKAREVLDRNKTMFEQIVKVITGPYYNLPEHLTKAFEVWRNGISSVVKDPKDIAKNWNLNNEGGVWIAHGDGKGKSWYKSYEFFGKEMV